MKTFLNTLNTLALCVISTAALALRPASTFTLVDPCARFTTVTAVAQARNCYSVEVTNPNQGDLDSYYTWNFGDGTTAQGMRLVHCYSATLTGNYPVTLTYNSPLCQQQPGSQAYTATLSAASSTDCSSDLNYTLNAQSVTVCCLYQGSLIPEMMYAFDYGDGTPATQVKTHTYNTCGSYVIKTHHYDMNFPSGGCYDFSDVNLACPPSPPTAIHKNKAGTLISVFPNPAKNMLTVSSATALKTAAIYDLSGRELDKTQFDVPGKEQSIETGSLAPGTYFLHLLLEDGAQQNLKFIKE